MRIYPKLRALAVARRLASVNLIEGPEGDQQMSLLSDNPEFPAGEQNSDESGANENAPMMRHEGAPVQAQVINSLNDLANNVGESGAPGNSMGPHSEIDDAHRDEVNTSEDPDLHMACMDDIEADVEAPYSDGMGPIGTNFEEKDDERKVMHARKKVGKGYDPYEMGHIYGYNELIRQHREDVRANHKGLGPNYKSLLWLRTAMPLWQIIDESEYWYRKNYNYKWKQADRNKTLTLAELFSKGATVTPLMVSPPGEDNGGLWEGYHRLRAFELLSLDPVPVIMKINPDDPVWQLRVAQFKRQPWVCVDFDGTIATKVDHPATLGDLIPGAQQGMAALMNQGYRVSIWTARQSDPDRPDDWQDEISKFMQEEGISYTDIFVGNKPSADVFIDDHAVWFDGNWQGIPQQVANMIDHHRVSGLLGVGDNKPDSYTDPNESRDDLAVSRDPALEGMTDKTAATPSDKREFKNMPLPILSQVAYVPPNPDGTLKRCDNCYKFVANANVCQEVTGNISPTGSCMTHVYGEPAQADVTRAQKMSKKLAGYVDTGKGTACITCQSYRGDATKGICVAIQESYEGKERPAHVKALGCCDRWWPKTRTAQIQFKPAIKTSDGKIWPCDAGFHDYTAVPEQYRDNRLSRLVSGFVDAAGRFYDRAEALQALDEPIVRPDMDPNPDLLMSEDLTEKTRLARKR